MSRFRTMSAVAHVEIRRLAVLVDRYGILDLSSSRGESNADEV